MATAALPEAPHPQYAAQTAIPQTSSSSSASQSTPQTGTPAAETPQQKADEQLKAEEKQRMLGIMPAFNAVESGTATPLTPKGKFELWYKSAIDPFTFATAGIDAGIEQAEDSYPEYHQGFTGFAKRYGASYADTVDGSFFGNAVLPVLLRQDPRYFRLGHGSAKQRLWYVALSTVRCKGDNGKWQPNYSNVAGNFIAGAISNAYYPASDRGVGLTLERGLVVTAEGAIGSLAFEFYPDAIAYLKRHHGHQPAAVAPPGASAAQP